MRREYSKQQGGGEIDGYTIVNALVGNGVDAVVKIPNTSLNSNETICFASMPTSQSIGYFYCSGKGSLRLMLLDVGTVNNRYDYSFGTNYMTLSVSTPHYARNVRHEFIQKRGSITIDGTEYATGLGSVIDTSPSVLCLFAADFDNNNNFSNFYTGKIYYFRRELNGEIIMDLIPVVRNSDNAIGMYDLVTNTFYKSVGGMGYE